MSAVDVETLYLVKYGCRKRLGSHRSTLPFDLPQACPSAIRGGLGFFVSQIVPNHAWSVSARPNLRANDSKSLSRAYRDTAVTMDGRSLGDRDTGIPPASTIPQAIRLIALATSAELACRTGIGSRDTPRACRKVALPDAFGQGCDHAPRPIVRGLETGVGGGVNPTRVMRFMRPSGN